MKYRIVSAVIAFSIVAFGQVEHFESTVLPILKANCLACHSDKNPASGISFQSRDMLLRGGNRGADPKVIAEAVKQSGELKMPPGKKLTPDQITSIEKWVGDGLPMPERMSKSKRPGADHWAYQLPKKGSLPDVKLENWVKTSLDRFVLARLEAANLKPAPEADRATLLRRVSLDLTGLPPTPSELADYLTDDKSGAYERVVDRLLGSKHYGERWGRHWLDIARYADSDGYTIDAPRDIWQYRDWVIDSMNKDMPFDQFTIEQMAGDLLPNPTREQLIATGLHRNTPSNFEGGIDFEQYRVEAVVDRVATTGAAFLGLTLGCARCHDHKFDPISQREFYQMYSFFNNVAEVDKEEDRKNFNQPFLELATPQELVRKAAYNAQLKALQDELAAYRKAATDPKDQGIQERLDTIRMIRVRDQKIPTTMVMKELPEPRPA